MTYNASNRKDIRKAEKAAKAFETMRVDFVIAAMSHRQGRAWFYDHLARCHMFHTTFAAEATHTAAFSEGERNIGLQTYSDIMAHCPDMFILMMQEAHEREITHGRRTADTAADDPDGDADEPAADEYGSGPHPDR